MNLIASTIVCFVPLLATFLICVIKKKYSFLQGTLAICVGLLSLVPIAILFFFIDMVQSKLNAPKYFVLLILIINCLIEETSKMICLRILKTENPQSFLSQSFTAGIALGSFESVVYLITGSVGVNLVLRLVSALILHGACALLSGEFVWQQKKLNKITFAFFWAFLLHAVYNFFSYVGGAFFYFGFAVIAFAFIKASRYSDCCFLENTTENCSNNIGVSSEKL